MKKLYLLSFLAFTLLHLTAQTTYQQVYNILQSNCTGTCHTQANPYNLVLTGTEQQVYAALVGVNPVNATALANGYKLVDPGAPRNSFLFSKVNHGLDVNLSLHSGEGTNMPDSVTVLTKTQREMIRQWILFGAKDTGSYVRQSLIDSFYNTQGGQPRIQPLTPPAASEGIQVYYGPIFMVPGQEFEYNNKFPIGNSGVIDVHRMTTSENPESHHFAIYDFYPGLDTILGPGLNRVFGIVNEAFLYYNASVVAQWPKSMDVTYPTGTALVWTPNTVLDLDYHLINFNDSIIAAEAYVNIYYQPHQSSTIAIETYPVRYGGDNVDALVIPNNGVDTTFRINQFDPDSTFYWNIISLQAHTHKLGTDFNVWTRKSDGSKDSLIYKGTYNPDYSFDLGVYIWNDPPYRQFTTPYPVYMSNGMIHEATFNNSGPDTVHFGLTTLDEMDVTFVLYYKSEFPAAINEPVFNDNNIKMYPNPANDIEYIRLDNAMDLKQTEMQFFNDLGQNVLEVKGITSHVFTANMQNLPSGCYTYRLINDGNIKGAGKIVVQR
jgi:hypothetical protein